MFGGKNFHIWQGSHYLMSILQDESNYNDEKLEYVEHVDENETDELGESDTKVKDSKVDEYDMTITKESISLTGRCHNTSVYEKHDDKDKLKALVDNETKVKGNETRNFDTKTDKSLKVRVFIFLYVVLSFDYRMKKKLMVMEIMKKRKGKKRIKT